MQGIEVGDAIDAEHDRFAVDYELLVPVLQCRLDDPRVAVGSVIAAARNQPHTIAVALNAKAVVVILDLVITTPGRLEPECLGWGCRTRTVA